MIPDRARLLELSSVIKQYGALRPLRIERLEITRGDRVALLGLDQPAAEVFINLVTGASLPDSGEIRVNGRATSEIADSADWLTTLDLFGIVSERAALLDPLSVVQNLAMPFSLEIEPPTDEVRERAVGLAREVQLPEDAWDRPVGNLQPASRLRLHLARALALSPSVLLLEHPTAAVPRADVSRLAGGIRDVAAARGIALVALTMDREFADSISARVLTLDPASGRVKEGRLDKIRFWS